MRTRGEGGASAVWTGHHSTFREFNGRAKPLDALGGGERHRRDKVTPTSNAIGPSSPVAFDVRVEMAS